MDEILRVESVKKSFIARNRCEIKVLCDISFFVRPGEILLIKGRSGEGKTTLLSIIAGIEKADSGRIFYRENEITAMTLNQLAELRADSIGLIFQSFNLIPTWTALENVEAVLMHRGLAKSERIDRASEVLKRLGLGDRMDNLPSELSVGQQQRVAVARTLVNNPSLILADEPTGDVDQETAHEIMSLIVPMIKAGKTAMVVTSHGSFNDALADRMMFLYDGCLHTSSRKAETAGA